MNNVSNSILYETVTIEGYNQLVEHLDEDKFKDVWVYRAQPSCPDLETTLERNCRSNNFVLEEYAEDIEMNMIRQFRRVYDGDDWQKVQGDILYCLSLMRHYGAPARLLDFTYSKYVATYFALECAYDNVPEDRKTGKPDYEGKRSCAIWCIRVKELIDKVEHKYPEAKELIESRDNDETRNDCTFKHLYWDNKYNLVSWENPVQLHRRLHLQQGVFLCPGNIKEPFMKNLLFPYGRAKAKGIEKVTCNLTPSELQEALEKCRRINLTRESLFPGLDGFAQSMKYQFGFYTNLAKWRKTQRGLKQ